MSEIIKTFDGEIKRSYIVDTSACKCGSGEVEYLITEYIREGWHDGVMQRLPRRLQEVQLDAATCPQCKTKFPFRLKTNHDPISDAEKLARQFHEAYERLAPSFGYETRSSTRAFDPDSPNGKLMIAVCDEVTKQIREDARDRGYIGGLEEAARRLHIFNHHELVASIERAIVKLAHDLRKEDLHG